MCMHWFMHTCMSVPLSLVTADPDRYTDKSQHAPDFSPHSELFETIYKVISPRTRKHIAPACTPEWSYRSCKIPQNHWQRELPHHHLPPLCDTDLEIQFAVHRPIGQFFWFTWSLLVVFSLLSSHTCSSEAGILFWFSIFVDSVACVLQHHAKP